MVTLAGSYRWNSESSCRTLDGTAFVLLGNRMVSLNEVGTFLWERLERGAELEQLVSAVVDAFETTHAQASADTAAFVSRLVGEAMLVPC